MPQPILNHYETSEFERWAFDVVGSGLTAEESRLFDLLKNNDARVLDIGCGGGRLSLSLQKRGFSRITGLDFSLKLSAAYAGRFASDKLPAINGTASSLPFKKESFDYILCLGNLLSFIDKPGDRVKALQEIERVLLPGGTALVSVLHFPSRAVNYLLYPFIRFARFFQKEAPAGHNLPWLRKGGKANLNPFSAREPQAYWFTEKEILSEIGRTSLHPSVVIRGAGPGIPFFCALRKVG